MDIEQIEAELNDLIDSMVDHIFRAELHGESDPSDRFIVSIQDEIQSYRDKAEVFLNKIKGLKS